MHVRQGLRRRIERLIARSQARVAAQLELSSGPPDEAPQRASDEIRRGVLLGSVSHEFLNTAVGLVGHLAMLRRELPDELSGGRAFARLEEASMRLRDLVLSTQTAACAGASFAEPLHVEETLRLAYESIRPALQSISTITWKISSELPRIRAPRAAFLDLCHAIFLHCDDHLLGVDGSVQVSAHSDPEHLSSRGSGPALIIAFCMATARAVRTSEALQSAARKLGGHIESLPARADRRGWRLTWTCCDFADSEAPSPTSDATRARPRILLIVGEARVRLALEAILLARGHELCSCDSFQSAELAMGAGPPSPQVIILDLPWDEAGGWALAEWLDEREAAPRLILIGESPRSCPDRWRASFGEVLHLSKPLEREGLLRIL